MHTGLDSKYNLSHQVDHGGKQPFPRILYCGGACKPRIDLVGIEQIFQHAARHHADWSLLNKRCEHFPSRHRHLCPSVQEALSPSGRLKVTKNINTLEGLSLWGSHGHLFASVWSTLAEFEGRFFAHENPNFLTG